MESRRQHTLLLLAGVGLGGLALAGGLLLGHDDGVCLLWKLVVSD